MASRLKEDEKNEKIIRSLLKLTPNRRCVNCNSLGPQYVCTNFWTFVCTTCSGIHREFTHRVKSVSMAKFTSQEVTALQGGGNERAKEVFLKEWDSERQSFPDSSNVDRLRDFIKHVYVDRRYTGEKRGERPPTGRMGDESYENRRRDTYQGGSRSPPYDNTYDRQYSDRPSPGGRSDDSSSRFDERSPGYDRESKSTSDYGRSPVRPEIVNDWRRDDRFGNTQRPERTISNGDSRSEGRSPDHQKDSNVSSPPVIRPVRDILGDNVIALKIDPPKANGIQAGDRSTQPPRVASSGSLGSSKENPVELKRATLGSLIDFDSEPPITASVPQTIQTKTGQIAQPTSSSNDSNWASFDMATETKAPQVPSNVNNLDSVLVQLSVPAPISGQLSGAPNNISAPTAVRVDNLSFFSSGQSNTEHLTSSVPGAPSNQSWNSPAVIMQAPGQLPQTAPRPAAQEIAPGSVSQPATSEVRSSGRRELPEDIFAANNYHPSFHVPGPGWQTAPPTGMGFMMQYNTAVPHPSFQQPSKSTNPFDFSNEAPPLPAPSFPSMSSLQGALPNIPSSAGLLPNSSLGAHSPSWMTPQSSAYISSIHPQASFASAMPFQVPPFASAMPTQSPSFPSAMPTQVPSFPTAMPSQAASFAPGMAPGTFMGQQVPNHMIPSRNLSGGGFGSGGAAFGSFNQNQLMAGGYSVSTAPNASPAVGGNPFG